MWTPVPATDPARAPHPTFTTLRLAGLKLAEKMPAMPELCAPAERMPGSKKRRAMWFQDRGRASLAPKPLPHCRGVALSAVIEKRREDVTPFRSRRSTGFCRGLLYTSPSPRDA